MALPVVGGVAGWQWWRACRWRRLPVAATAGGGDCRWRRRSSPASAEGRAARPS